MDKARQLALAERGGRAMFERDPASPRYVVTARGLGYRLAG